MVYLLVGHNFGEPFGICEIYEEIEEKQLELQANRWCNFIYDEVKIVKCNNKEEAQKKALYIEKGW